MLTSHLAASSSGEAVVSAIGGVVTEVSYSHEQGNYVTVCDNNSVRTTYGHLNDTSVQIGQRIAAGDKIGSAGATGFVTGACLSFYVYVNDLPVDPVSFYE